ncbi:MAG TPA: response regulator, partial [Novosphingobium sp.]|nr:response regulator [Novosphingobium sp.]
YLVDDDASLRNSIRFLLSNHGRDVTSFERGEDFLARQCDLVPGPILLDVQMNGMDGLAVQKQLQTQGCHWPVIILTGHGDISMAVRAIKAGAVDFLTKPFARADLLSVLAQADARLLSQDAILDQSELARHRLAVLTLREQQVLNELARGLPNKTIGYDLGISARTVEIHRANVMRKLGVQSFPDALRIAFAAGMPFANVADLAPPHGQVPPNCHCASDVGEVPLSA